MARWLKKKKTYTHTKIPVGSSVSQNITLWSEWSWQDPEPVGCYLMLCPSHTSLQKDWEHLHIRTDAVMLQKARWGRQQAGFHSTLLRLWVSMLSATSHCQQYLFKTSTWPLRANKLRAKRLVLALQCYNIHLTWASSTKKLSGSAEEFPCIRKFMRCVTEGPTNTYRSATAP